jgi:hypothetical protein
VKTKLSVVLARGLLLLVLVVLLLRPSDQFCSDHCVEEGESTEAM